MFHLFRKFCLDRPESWNVALAFLKIVHAFWTLPTALVFTMFTAPWREQSETSDNMIDIS